MKPFGMPPAFCIRLSVMTDESDFMENNMDENTQIMIWDSADVLKRVMGKEKILKVLVAAFLVDMPNYVQILEGELNNKDVSAAAKTAHTIKGAAGNMSTLALADLAKDIERACLDESSIDEILTFHAKLMQVFPLTCNELSAWLSEHS